MVWAATAARSKSANLPIQFIIPKERYKELNNAEKMKAKKAIPCR